MSNHCLWCDTPCEGTLCVVCKAVNDHPLYYCKVNARHTPTLGDSCAECDFIAARRAAVAAENAPIVEQLCRIRDAHIRDWHRPWPGLEFGKAHFGMMLDHAIDRLKNE